MPASTMELCTVGSTPTVLMMSAATRNYSPSRIERPRLERNAATGVSRDPSAGNVSVQPVGSGLAS